MQPSQGERRDRVNAFRLGQATLDASKAVTSYRTRRDLKLRMIAARSHFLVGRRPLPAFLIIGVMRGGTSSLFKYLASHPDTAASLRKEVRFFTRYWDKGLDWYRAHFPITRRRLAFEATPDYLFHPFGAALAAETLPNAKLIVLLRDPLARARSHYAHMVRLGRERRSFEGALAGEDRLVQDALARFEENPHAWQPSFFHYSYLSRGHYAGQLEKWLEVFSSENMLVLWSEDFYSDPVRILDRVAEFLSIRPGRFSGVGRNYSVPVRSEGTSRGREETEAAAPGWVIARVEEQNRQLLEVLGRRLPGAGLPPWLTSIEPSRANVLDGAAGAD